MNGSPIFICMGVAGCGKSTIAAMLADRLGCLFLEGDSLHPPANVAKMKQGIPLKDVDRHPWLEKIGQVIDDWRQASKTGVIACSALKKQYRQILRKERPEVRFIYLRGSKEIIAERMANRSGHFMPLSLLDSQFATLEEPQPDENAFIFDVSLTPGQIINLVLRTI